MCTFLNVATIEPSRSTSVCTFHRRTVPSGRSSRSAYPRQKPITQTLRLVEQRLGRRVGHRRLVEVVGGRDVVDEPSWEERGEREFGEHDQVAALAGGFLHQHDQALDDGRPIVGALHRAELGSARR